MNADLFVVQSARLAKGALIGLSLTLIAASPAAAPPKSPSSLQRPGAVVHFTHSQQRVASCKLQPNTLTCSARKVPGTAGADLTLTPAPDELVSQPELKRQPRSVALPSRQGVTNLDVHLEAGNWMLSWADQHAAFQVEAQRDFAIQLVTTSGACAFEEGQCRRHDDVVTRKVSIPPDLRGAE